MRGHDIRLYVSGLFAAISFVSTLHVSAFAQNLIVAPAPTSPHWSHINILDFGRGISYIPDATQRATAYQWFSTHVDVAETNDTSANALRANNASMKLFRYAIDATMFTSDSDVGLAEEAFLHASENTTLEFHDLANNPVATVNIPGCPQTISKTCRYQAYIWTSSRWVFNPKSTAYRTAKANQLLALAQAAQADGVFLDEHAPSLKSTIGLDGQTFIKAGGGILEYGGVQPSSADTAYNTDVVGWLGSLRTVFKNANKFVLPNLADYTLDQRGIDQIMAAGGVTTEYLFRPDRLDRNQFQMLMALATNLVASGGMLDLYGSIGYLGPSGYTTGNYGTSAARYRMWRVAGYYILKEPVGSPGRVYFDPNLNIDFGSSTPTSFINEWLPAYQVNVGQPAGATTLFQQGTNPTGCAPYIIFGRQYTNALVLVRPGDSWACTDYGDASAVVVPLPQPMSMLNSDGTLALASSTIKIRNGEAVIMFPSSSTGSTSTSTGTTTNSTGSTSTSTGSTSTTTTSTGSTSTSTGSSSPPTKNVPPGQLKKQDSLYDQILGWMKLW